MMSALVPSLVLVLACFAVSAWMTRVAYAPYGGAR